MEIEILLAVQVAVPLDARAPYYLGNLLYDRRRYREAIACRKRARALDPSFPTVHRNLGIAEANVLRRPVVARRSYLRAFAADPADGRVLFELDQLLMRQNAAPGTRLAPTSPFGFDWGAPHSWVVWPKRPWHISRLPWTRRSRSVKLATR